MLEILLGVLLAIGELFLDALLELAAGALVDVGSRIISSVFDVLEIASPIVATFVYTLLGAVVGGLSVLVLPHHLVRPLKIPGLSLLVSPMLAGTALSLIGASLRSRDKEATRIESFRYGFAFALGMALIRLLFVR